MLINKQVVKIIDTNNFEQLVEKYAYELFVKRGFENGHDWDDWFEAQKQVEAQMSTIDRDCVRSETFFKSSHQNNPTPSEVEAKEVSTGSFLKDF